MRVTDQDADLFYKLTGGLQFYVNQQNRILPNIDSLEHYNKLSHEDTIQVRDALWNNPEMINAYVKENPDGLSDEELDIVRKWKQFISGNFQIYRFLKKHAIFIGEDSKVYGVLGTYDGLTEIDYAYSLPVLVEAVLLPFKGAIVYDGVLRIYNIYFGKGIRSDLHEIYMTAKQNGRIITTLEPELTKPARKKPKKSAQEWKQVIDDLVTMTEKMRGGPVTQSRAFSLLRASARLAQAAVHSPDDLDDLWREEGKVRRALSQLQTTLYRAEQ